VFFCKLNGAALKEHREKGKKHRQQKLPAHGQEKF
jgi:hypothetical protein